MIKKWLWITGIVAAAFVTVDAQLPQNRGGLYAEIATDSVAVADCGKQLQADSLQSDIRINPEIENPEATGLKDRVDYSAYPWLDMRNNRIDFNGADWSAVRKAFAGCDSGRVTVVHLGDSHIQADGATEVTRRNLQARYGNGGRGFVAPLKIAGTNEPLNYILTSSSQWNSAVLLRTPWAVDMQFSGVSISPKSEKFDLTVNTSTRRSQADPFRVIRVFYGGAQVSVDSVSSAGIPLAFDTEADDGVVLVALAEDVPELTLCMSAKGTTFIAGLELLKASPGLVYTAIGNNGACFSSYAGLGIIGSRVARMRPALVVLSMGTNEAFSTMLPKRFRETVGMLVDEIKAANPQAAILIVTPQECHKRIAARRRKGRRRSGRFTVNQKVRTMRDELLAFCRDEHVAVYDYYSVAGGEGSAQRWIDAGLFGRDRIHLNWDGYALMGQLLADAVEEAVASGVSTEK